MAAYYELRTKYDYEITKNIYKRNKYNDRITAYNNRISSYNNETAAYSNTTSSYNNNNKPEDHWSCIAHLIAEDMLKSAVIQEKKFKNIECK